MYFITTKRMLEVCFSAHPNIQYRTGFFQSLLFLENCISSDYDTLAVQRESEKRRRKIREDHLQDF